ncbi:TPA: terminase large subunit [Aeromonas hydrophila]|uniref:Terminase large subunit n=1 Tax=Aeromonas hydrophila TaxID=644 RepID=A0AAD3YLF5_AERHY|nr:terminase large subunit [Aeromonas hydrophila]
MALSEEHPLITNLEEMNIRAINPDLEDAHGNKITDGDFQGLEAVYQYTYDVLTGVRNASASEKLHCQRFLNDCSRTDLVFNLKHFMFVLRIGNTLKHSKGSIAGARIFFMPWQQFVLANLFGFYFKELIYGRQTRTRRFNKVFCMVSRGNAKTQLAAIVGVMGILLSPNGQPTCTTSASSRHQAKVAFNEIKTQIMTSALLRKEFRCLSNEIKTKDGGTIYPTSAESKSLDGQRISVAVLDEVHTYKDSSVPATVESGTQSSHDPIIFAITTAGTNTRSYCKEQYDYAKEILNGTMQNDQYLAIVFESDIPEHDSLIGFEQANPSLGKSVSLLGLQTSAQAAAFSESLKAEFCTKHLNRWYSYTENGMLDSSIIENCFSRPFPSDAELSKLRLYCGLDLAAVSDLTSCAQVWVTEDGKFFARTKNFIPKVALDTLPSTYTSLYNKAIGKGSLVIAGDVVTDLEAVAEHLASIYATQKPKDVGIDAAAGGLRFAEEFKGKHRRDLTSVRQGFGLSLAAYNLIRQASLGNVVLDPNDEMLRWCLENCRVRNGQQGDISIVKSQTNQNLKIDAAIALLNALALIPAFFSKPQARII